MILVLSANVIFTVINFRRELIVSLLEDGHELHIVASRDDKLGDLSEYNVIFHHIEINKKGKNPFQDYALIRQYKKIYKEINPDFILQFTIKPNIYGSIAASKLNIPVINNVTGLGMTFEKRNVTNRIVKILYKKSFKTPKKIFFQNPDDLSLFVGNNLVRKEITDLLPGSGVDLNNFDYVEKTPSQERVFLMVSRITKSKGVEEYINAARMAIEAKCNAKFLLVGKIPSDGKDSIAKNDIDKWVKEGIIEYLGVSNDIRKEIRMSDCIVLPSKYREGTPRSLLEGLAMGKPIVTTKNVGCKETVINQVNGFLVEMGSVNSLYNSINNFCNLSAQEVIDMGIASRKLAEEKFDVNIVIDKYKELLKK